MTTAKKPKSMTVLVEGVGSPAWGTIEPFMHAAFERIIALDIDPLASGLYLADKGIIVPPYHAANCFHTLESICANESVDVVFPTINEGLNAWAERKPSLAKHGTTVMLSQQRTINLFSDKWKTFEFFTANEIPTPATSLEPRHPLLKPRNGRGGSGIRMLTDAPPPDEMSEYVTQALLTGQEYSVDVLCDLQGEPVYIVPRKRLAVRSGLSVKGIVVRHDAIEQITQKIIAAGDFIGPVNLQCFDTDDGIYFTEINPRIAGGMPLSMAATENWFQRIRQWLCNEPSTAPQKVQYGLVMTRHYRDCFQLESELVQP